MNIEAQEEINVDDETIVQDNYVEGDLDDEEDRNDELEDEDDDRR